MAYCTPANLRQWLPRAVLNQVTNDQLLQACDDASSEADSYMRGRYTLPLVAWGPDVTKFTAWIACYNVVQLIGFNARAGSDDNIVHRYYQAVGWPDKPGTGWFPGIQRQAIQPDVTPTVDPVNSPITGLPQVRTSTARGWQRTANGKPVI